MKLVESPSDLHGRRERRRKSLVALCMDDSLSPFGPAMRDAEMEKVNLEGRMLEFGQRRHEDMMCNRAAERQHQAADRKGREMAYMARLQVMLDLAVSSISKAK